MFRSNMEATMEIASLIEKGWRIVPIRYGSKNPGSIVGEAWQTKYLRSIDQIPDIDANYGLILGPGSGVYDVEYDSDQGRDIIESVLAGIVTPTYKSAKSTHRLFVYEDWCNLERAKFGHKGTEWRFGQDNAQSIIPPSMHESGVLYEWLPGLSPFECEPVVLPVEAKELFQKLKDEFEHKEGKSAPIKSRDYDGDGLVDCARKHLADTSWQDLLEAEGWTFCRARSNGAQDWYRPGKKSGCISATLNYGGTDTLRVFSTSCSPLEADSSYDKFAFLCALHYENDPMQAAKGIVPQDEQDRRTEEWKNEQILENIEMIIDQCWGSKSIENADEENDSDDDFCNSMIPPSGILKLAFDFYLENSYRSSPVMGLAVSLALCQTIFGRRIRSHTDMRTNDYNLILATTGSGKEACESTITKILIQADPACRHIIPPDVQSGNGLMKAISCSPCAIWICDEFGKILQAVLDKKGNQHVKNIGNHLLKLYGKSNGVYGGAAHSDGVRNAVIQPHLCVLGLSTSSTVFDAVSSDNVSDGLLGRIAFWPVQDRPDPKDDMEIAEPSEELVELVRSWVNWAPGGNLATEYPKPEVLRFSAEAKDRWNQHAKDINERMRVETESRAAIWSRVAARTMKLALVSRASRLEVPPSNCVWDFVAVEIQDVNWAVKLSNWLARIACGLVKENTVDKSAHKAKMILQKALESGIKVSTSELLRRFRGVSSGELMAAASELGYEITTELSGGRPRKYIQKKG